MSSSDQNNQGGSPPSPNRRRSSFVDMFNPRSSVSSAGQPPRRLSITTLGLSTLPGAQTSPFNNMRVRAESTSSANSGSVDESPFEDDSVSPPPGHTSASVPVTPFGRRMSFGASRSMRAGSNGGPNGVNANGTANGRPPVSSASFANKASASSPPMMSREGFDFAETLRARAERGSISGGFGGFMTNQQQDRQSPPHHRAKSVAVMEPPKAELPKQTRPDAFQERILKGDFYMD